MAYQADVVVGKSEGYKDGEGPFFKALGLGEEYTAIIYYPKFSDSSNTQIVFRIYKYDNGFSSIFYKEMKYTSRKADVIYNEFYKVNDNRLIFVTKNDKLYFYLFDLFDSYSKIIVNIFEYSYTNYDITKDMTLYYFNAYIYFTGTIKVSDSETFSFLITFGFANGKDSVLDISPYLKDSNNTDINLNLFDYFLDSSVIDNNIFNYSIVEQVKLLIIKNYFFFSYFKKYF